MVRLSLLGSFALKKIMDRDWEQGNKDALCSDY